MGRSLGILLIVIGLILFIWTGFTYTQKEKVVDAGSIEITADRQKNVSWPPYVGGVVLLVGLIVFISSKKQKD
ncbi:DUF3185 family protein [Pedobacter sp.]|uniref:DUF3185 family protein n=1 Tax=Pedobacter sp. TaxID=1411316 RepID=UPI00396C4CA4